MLRQLKKRLLVIYMLTTCLLLNAVILILYMLSIKQFTGNNIQNFENHVRTISELISSSSTVYYKTLSKMEAENHLIIFISSNLVPLDFKGAWTPPTDRQELIDKVNSFAADCEIAAESAEMFESSQNSPIYSLYGKDGEHYFGSKFMKRNSNSVDRLIVIQLLAGETEYKIKQLIFFAIIDISGMVAIFFISILIVNKSLTPLKEGLRRQNEFIAAASHELRSPLTVIMAGISTLKLENAPVKEVIPCIDREGERMKRLINDMLLIASSDAKMWELNIEMIEMETFLITSYDSLSQLCIKKKQKLELNLPEKELSSFMGDRLRIEQILIILVDNASSYSEEGAEIIIQILENRKNLMIEVIDHGCGIPAEDKKRIFERFYRSDHSRSDKNHFGLGLSIASELVNLHGGRISVRDTFGGGSTFEVELPVTKLHKT